jgi:uncharacterized protein (DUF2342 family)
MNEEGPSGDPGLSGPGEQKMKEQKPLSPATADQDRVARGAPETGAVKPDWGQARPLRSGMEQKPSRLGSMQTSEVSGKTRGRLSREVLSKLGKTLEDYFDDVRKHGVPERFRKLHDHFDVPKDQGSRE